MKRILSFVLTLCLIIGLLPAVALPKAHAAVESATLTLFGTNTTINAGETLYWVNGEGTAKPVAATAADDWNYSLAIVDGNVVFTMRNAEYSNSASFLYASFDGTLKVDYEGINNISISKTLSSSRYFLKYQSATNAIDKGYLYLQGGDGAVLNVTGGGSTTGLLQVANKASLYIIGGTVNLEKTSGASYPVIHGSYARTQVKNCTLNVTQLGASGVSYPTWIAGYSSYALTIQDSDVTVTGPNSVGICAGVFLSSLKGVDSSADVNIKGKSNVKITTTTTDSMLTGSYSSYRYMGSGIYCKALNIQGGSLEVSSRKNAIQFSSSSTTGPVLTSYTTEYPYEMFVAKDGEAVTEYTQSGYFKLAAILPCEHKNTTTTEAITKEPTCGDTGIKTFTVSCFDCGEVANTWEVPLPATNDHNYDAVTGVCSGCGDVEIPIEGPTWPTDVTFATAEQMANVVLEKKASAGGSVTAHPGGKITYKISITNNNAEPINVHVEDMIPKGTKLLSGCDYTSGRALYWVEENIAPGETRVITYNVKPDYTLAEVRASEFDIILTNHDAKVMDVTIPATEDIWVLETFNAEDIRKMEMAIDAMVTAYQPKLKEITLLNMIFNVGFTAGPGLGTTDPNAVLEMIFEKAGENLGGSTGSGEDATDTALNLLDRVPPHLYGGTAVPAEKDELFRGARATEVTINDLISGDLLFVKNNGETKLYIVDNSCLVYLGKTEVIRKIDPATVLPGLATSEQFVVIRPSINYNITFGLQEGEYYNDADKNGYTEVEKAIIATAEAFLLRGDRAQYTDDMTGTSLYRWESGVKQPEYYTVDQYGYTNCAAFTYDANYMTTGYAAKNGNTTLNTTAANAAFAKANWNFETGTSSNKGVVYYAEPMQKDASGTYVCTLTEEEKAAMKAEIISLLRPGDIINIRRTTGSGHAMLYVGNGTIIHSGGGNYSTTNKTDTHEATIRFRMVEDLFDPAIYAETSCVYYLASFALLRPSAMTTKGATQNSLNRMNNMQGIIGEKVASTAMGKTVNCGDEITYTFYVFNTNNEDKVITINDVLSQYVTFVSATNDATVNGNNISWNITVPADTRISVSYTVKVNDGVAAYTAIDGSKATINGVAHKCIDSWVANTLTAGQQQTLIEAVNKVKEMDVTGMNGVQIANLIYKEAFGIENLFGENVTTMAELINGDTDNDSSTKGVDNIGIYNDTWYWESSNTTSVTWMPNYNTSNAAQMVAPGLYGGQLVYQSSYNKNGRDESQTRYLNVADGTLRSRYFWEKDLVIGDLFVMSTQSSQRSLYIYVGNDTFISIGEGHTVFSNQSVSARFQYAPHTTWKYLAVLRPSMIFEEEINKCEHDWADATCTESKTCTKCGATDGAALGHKEETVAGKEATCTESGLTEGKKCSTCGEILAAQETIPAAGHKEAEPVKEKETATSYDSVVYCSVCSTELSRETIVTACAHANTVTAEETVKAATCKDAGIKKITVTCKDCGETVSETTEKIATLDHTEEIIPARAPTCTANGRTEGKKCSVCGEILVAQEVVPAISHTFDENGNCVCGASQPVITIVDECFRVEMNDFEYVKGYIFYIEQANAEGVDLTNWSAVMAASKKITGSPFSETDDWKSFSQLVNLNNYTIPNETGTYVLFVEYQIDANTSKRVSASIEIVKKPKVTCGKDMFAVDMDGLTYNKGYIFYMENAEGVDLSGWDTISAAAKNVSGSPFGTNGYKSFTQLANLNNYLLPYVEGDYVLLFYYTDENGVELSMAKTIRLENLVEAEITFNVDRFTVNTNGLKFYKSYFFYLESAEGVDLTNWTSVKTAAEKVTGSPYSLYDDWKTCHKQTTLESTVLPNENGVYVLFVDYWDVNGSIRQATMTIEVNDAVKPEITSGDGKIDVDMNGLAYQKAYIFYVETTEGLDTRKWSPVMSASKVNPGSPFNSTDNWKSFSNMVNLLNYTLPEVTDADGTYIMFLEYVDINNTIQQVSAVINK